MGQLNCSLEIPKPEISKSEISKSEISKDAKGSDPTFGLTVGQVFYLKCQGEIPKEIASETGKDKLELRLEAADKYKLVLLKSGFPSSSEVVFQVTTYKPGRHHIKAPQIVSGDFSVVLSDLDLEVTSVINAQEKPEGPIALGALTLSIPPIYWLFFAATLISIVVLFGIKWYRIRLRKNLLRELSVHDSAQTPFQQFHARMRKMQRSYSFLFSDKIESFAEAEELRKFVSEVNEAYRIFLSRSFKVPALQWKNSLVLADLKKHKRKMYDEFGLEIKNILKELEKSLGDSLRKEGQISKKDCQQFVDITRRNVDQLEIFKTRQELQTKGGSE